MWLFSVCSHWNICDSQFTVKYEMKPTHFTVQASFQIGATNENDHEQTGPRFFMVPHSLKFCSLSYLHW